MTDSDDNVHEHDIHVPTDVEDLLKPELCRCGKVHPKMVALSINSVIDVLDQPEIEAFLKKAGMIVVAEGADGETGWGVTEMGAKGFLTMLRFIDSVKAKILDEAGEDTESSEQDSELSFVRYLKTLTDMGCTNSLMREAAKNGAVNTSSPMSVGTWKEL